MHFLSLFSLLFFPCPFFSIQVYPIDLLSVYVYGSSKEIDREKKILIEIHIVHFTFFAILL